MIAAADTALLDDAELQRRITVAAVEMHGTVSSGLVLEDDEILAQRTDLQGNVGLELREIRDRVPIATQIFAARCSATNLRQEKIGLAVTRLIIASEIQRARVLRHTIERICISAAHWRSSEFRRVRAASLIQTTMPQAPIPVNHFVSFGMISTPWIGRALTDASSPFNSK